jgi:hypothetical protein
MIRLIYETHYTYKIARTTTVRKLLCFPYQRRLRHCAFSNEIESAKNPGNRKREQKWWRRDGKNVQKKSGSVGMVGDNIRICQPPFSRWWERPHPEANAGENRDVLYVPRDSFSSFREEAVSRKIRRVL